LLLCAAAGRAEQAEVETSTVTGSIIDFDDASGVGVVTGSATVVNATGTMTADRITIDTKTNTGIAEGNVRIVSGTSTLTGQRAEYHWEASTGTLDGAVGATPPWRFEAEKMRQAEAGYFEVENVELTSCDLDPPHYRSRASRGRIRTGVRAKMSRARMVLDETPSIFFPYYTRSLKPKKYSIRIEPGSSSRDGFTNRTILGYPFSANTYTKLRWDYLQYTGNGAGIEHRYFNPNIRGDFDAYYIRDTNPDEQPQSRRYSVLLNHYQRFTPRLTMNAKLDVKSDQTFGNEFSNVGNDVRVENQTRGLFSEGGLTYQFPRAAVLVQADRLDRFDSTISSSNFISKLTLPRLNYNTIPLIWKYFPIYTSFTASYVNETVIRTSPKETLRYQKSSSGGVQLKKDLKVRKKTTVTPIVSYQQTWRDRDVATSTSSNPSKDIYQGRYTTGLDLRQRFGRTTDANFAYRYGERLEKNRTKLDSLADDRGVETHVVNSALVTRVGRDTRLSFSSGYDFRRAPKSDPGLYNRQAARVVPPTVDVQWQATRLVSVFFRETYGLYDPGARRNVRSPLNTSGDIQIGNVAGKTFFSQGFSYTKPATGATSDLILTNKVRFYPSPKWHLDFYLSYRAIGEKSVDYRKVAPIEKTIQAVRDLHCWVLRMQFSERPGRKEASFFIDLKANMRGQREMLTNNDPDLKYNEVDVSQIFPEPAGEEAQHLLVPSVEEAPQVTE